MKNENDVVVTGLGIVSPIGIGLEAFNQSLHDRKSGVKLRESFAESDWPFRIGGIIDDYDPKQYVKPRKSLKLMCREIQFGFGAAQLALADAKLESDAIDPERAGVVCGSDSFYCDPDSITDSYKRGDEIVTDVSDWIELAMKSIEPLWMLKYLPNMIASHIAISIDARGPNNSIMQGDASGLLALIEAADVIRRGWADVMITGGTGSKINPTYLAYHGTDNLAKPGEDPTTACRPFDKNRTGTVCAEGAGMIVLERRSHAENRGAEIYGSLGAFDYGHSLSDKEKQIQLVAQKIDGVISKAGLTKDDISHVNSYASGEVEADEIAAQGIQSALGQVGVTAYKSHFGDIGPAGATIETCAMLHALKSNVIPGTINYETPDENCPVNVISEHLEQEQQAAIKLSSSVTGQKVAVLFEAES